VHPRSQTGLISDFCENRSRDRGREVNWAIKLYRNGPNFLALARLVLVDLPRLDRNLAPLWLLAAAPGRPSSPPTPALPSRPSPRRRWQIYPPPAAPAFHRRSRPPFPLPACGRPARAVSRRAVRRALWRRPGELTRPP
jgi:hypothetical protein